LTIAEWRDFPPAEAAAEVRRRLAALPAGLRQAAVAWERPEVELRSDFTVGAASRRDGSGVAGESRQKAAPTAPILTGIPYFTKDLFDVAGAPTKAGSAFLPEVRPTPGDSALVRRFRELGAVLAGKTHLVEFAAGLTGENRTYGDCPHPFFPDRLTGGSSSGSAALVAAGVVPFATGTDTGGSVRVPAAFCGLFGYRGAPGHEWIRDAVPLSPSCDTAGWFTRTAEDLRTLNAALLGQTTTAAAPAGCFVPVDLMPVGFRDGIAEAYGAQAVKFGPPVGGIFAAELPGLLQDSFEAYGTLVMREARAIHRDWLGPYRERYDPAIWQRISDAANFTPERLTRAENLRRQIRGSLGALFEEHDYLVLPCAPCAAPRKADCTPELRRSILTLTALASLGGRPVLTIPFTLSSGLTGGLQLIMRDENPARIDALLART
jgi:amidase/aspartyl-tRNA(Asn)/glutamyl-tRNA(Gln) amidotransferase subunit A